MFKRFLRREREHEAIAPGPWGPCKLVELVNTGGMADLWLATDAEARSLAVRILLPHLRADGTSRRRFISGGRILEAVQEHPYVVRCHAQGQIRGIPYQSMEYVEGANLKERMADPPEEMSRYVGNILIDMGEALEHVHDRGFLHLDFKPENILVTANWNVRLIDFDLARPRRKHTFRMAGNPGTPAYMAPEQLQRKPIDHRTDIFAYGVAAYEILTGQKPFPGDTPAEILHRQLHRERHFILPRTLNPGIPPGVERTLLKSLETEADRRHGLMSVLLHELRTALYI